MKGFLVRTVSLLSILLILASYNEVLAVREKDDEIARLNAKVAALEEYVQDSKQTAQADLKGMYRDGEWDGEAEGFGGTIRVRVSVEDGRIQNVQILSAEEEDPAYLSMAKAVLTSIEQEQGAEVDAVSGATFSSEGIINAAAQALEKAEK